MKVGFIFIISVLLSLILTIIPLPSGVLGLRPAWALLIILYWMLMRPSHIGLGFAFGLGLYLDLLLGSPMGLHALALTIVAYLIVRFRVWFSHQAIVQQTVFVALLTVLYLLIQYLADHVIGTPNLPPYYWLSAVTTSIIWRGVRPLLST